MSVSASLAGVTKRYGATKAVDAVSFDVAAGEMFGLIGPDGAGKTTTLRLLCGLLKPDAGSISVLGLDPIKDHRRLTQRVGYFSQRFSLYGDLSVDENIAFFAEIHGLRRYGDRRTRLLDMMQLTPFRERLADRLSGGMKQKLALACTLVHEPEMIFLDEPTTGVDPVSRREFWKLLSEFLSQGITIVMTTPYLDEAERCSRVAMLHEGKLVALDRPGELRRGYVGAVIELVAEPQAEAIRVVREIEAVSDTRSFGERLHLRLDESAGDRAPGEIEAALRLRGVAIRSLRRVPPSLEDVFIDRVTQR